MFNFPVHPRLLHFQVTERCNLRCPFCIYGTGRNVGEDDGNRAELSADEVGEIFRDPGLQHLDIVRLTGGEPLLRGDLPRLVLAIHRAARPDLIYLTTNGSFPERLDEFLGMILPAGIRLQLQLSIDGIGKAHDRKRGAPGTFEKVEQSITYIRTHRERYPFFAGINCTLFGNTVAEGEQVERLARRFGLGFRMVIAARYSENTRMDIDPLKHPVPFLPAFPAEKSELEELFRRLDREARPGTAVILSQPSLWELGTRYLVRGEKNRSLGGKASPRPPCTALFTHFRLLPDGEVTPCTGLPAPVGNLRDESFSRLWKSRRSREARRRVKQCRGCWIECDILPSAFYSGAILPGMITGLAHRFLRLFSPSSSTP